MDLVGKVLAGRYEIIEEIGKGGMANVYKAHCNLLKRNVAIKALRDDLENDKEFVRRFNIEAQAAASLSNPHIVSIYDVGCENGQYYIVMEYIEGKTLKEYIDEVGVIPWKEAIGYALQICDALEEAHKNSVVHRDIKPQNIIMTPDGVLKVTDFGIARATSQVTMTMGKNTIGTAHYLSPEQARGGYTDGRSDIYSLGIVLYEMITGRLPFNDESPVTIAIKHLQEKMIPPTEVNPDIPEGLETVVLKATEKEQNSRYSTVTEMAADLNAVLKNPNAALQSGAVTAVLGGGDETIKIPAIGDRDVKNYENGKAKSGAIQYTSEAEDDLKKAEEIREKRERREQKKKDRRITIAAILAAVLVIGGLGAAFMYFANGAGIIGTGDETIEIPQVVGMNLQKAQAKYKGQYSIVEYDKVDSTKEAGTIVEQDPAAGEKRQKRDDIVIRVTVSTGKSSLTLSDYTNMDVNEAKAQLEQAGLKANIIEKYSDSTPANKVLSQEPKAGSSVGAGDLITLYVSKGSENSTPSNDNHNNNGNSNRATEKPDVTNPPEVTTKPTAAPTEKPSAPTKKPSGGSGDDNEGSGGTTGGGSNGGAAGGGETSGGGTSGGNSTSGGGNASGSGSGTTGGGSNDGGATEVED